MTSGSGVTRRAVAGAPTSRANRRWWDSAADDYQAEHGAFLGDAAFVWCPEGLDEAQARLLGEVRGRRVLEIGCGAGQCGRWLAGQGAEVAAFDLSFRQLQHSRRIDDGLGARLPVVQADAGRLPFAGASFDLACSAFGALPFVADAGAVLAEVRRVLRPGGRFVFSVSHPVRWAFPDDPGERGLTADRSYFDRAPYVEQDEHGEPSYVEHHRTLGDWVGAIVGAGLTLTSLVEPEWPQGHTRTWGGWSPLRGRHLPGTAIFTCERARTAPAGDGNA
ncbi:class I SAM-dependent methyltransferase [Sphaerisporangium sp. TRM90804]|uniref:class I SAM-dependent methyltransferase n=1 Tax=Sphaerisporangium sp. TRM90804 TaxID=3031113 RepID=UPI00244A45E4|nr:class I SAM-dependent methyltransferase [Sphaerisporangium sp. TRM90804]MDH2424598.1 methyltransferase domain-containing protein [Sphaerisporangium sp. TRM90804]